MVDKFWIRRFLPFAMLMLPGIVFGQGVMIETTTLPSGARVVRSGSASRSSSPTTNPKPGEKPDEKKPDSSKKGAEDKKDAATPKTITRADYKPDPSVEPPAIDANQDGEVKFNFHGAPWPVVLDWLARFSSLNLDWQELPSDYLNLRTQRAYSAIEARDIVNRHLLARGFTLLQHDELLTVVKISGLNPGLVPRITPEELMKRMPHEYVKVSLPLDWILAADAVEQLKPMLSPNGKLFAIASVNRLEAMDVAVNLQEVFQLLNDEQSGSQADKGLVREFKLQHVRAVVVIGSLYGILGLRKPESISGGSGSISGSMSRQIMQQLQRMQQQQQQRGSSSSAKGGKEQTEPRLVLNERENSILAHASPDKMEIIEQTIKAMDVPSQRNSHILQNLDRMKVYRLSTLKPEPLVKILSEIGDLSPSTKLQIDSENNSIIVFGELADHVTVQSLVDRLDGSTRNFEVISLRRLRASDVAGTIQYMLGEEEEEEDNSRSRYYGYYSYGSQPETKKDKRPFRVDADIENNRLLIWANETEIEEVQSLLIKMGEFPSGQTNPATSRVIDLYSEKDAARLLEQIQRVWKQNQHNELKIETLPSQNTETSEPAKPVESKKREVRRDSNFRIQYATDQSVVQLAPTEEQSPQEPKQHPLADAGADITKNAPPVTIRQLPDGRLQLESNDPKALDELEFIISELAPSAPDYKIFQVEHAWPFGIELILLDFFESDDDEEQVLDLFGRTRTFSKDSPDRLSKQRKLKIISDDDSRTILVQGASAQQLAIIEDLIQIYDRSVSSDPQAIRVTKIFHLEYSEAVVLAETVKSVYRDLLSANDPALQNKDKEAKQKQLNQGITFSPYRNNDDKKDDKEEPQQPIKFKGLLSVGTDEISNTIVVSAASGLIDGISELIETLDEAAKPTTTVQVVPVHPGISASFLRERLNQSFGTKTKISTSSTGGRRGNRQNQKQPQPRQGQQNNGQPSGTPGQ